MTVREVVRLGNLPVYQNKMFDTAVAARSCPRGDVVLAQDEASGLVSNVAFDPRRLDYDQSYQNEQGSRRRHFRDELQLPGRNPGDGRAGLQLHTCGRSVSGFMRRPVRARKQVG